MSSQALLQGRLDAAVAEDGAGDKRSSSSFSGAGVSGLPPPLGRVDAGDGEGGVGPWEEDALAEQTRRQRRRKFAVPPCELQTAGEAPEFHLLDPPRPEENGRWWRKRG